MTTQERNHLYWITHKETIQKRCHERYMEHQDEEILKNRANYQRIGKTNRLKRKDKMRLFLLIRKAGGCVICGERDPVVLEFHHVDPLQKENAIGHMLDMPMYKVKAELEKCVVLCANDHIRVQKGVVELPKGKR